MAKERPRRKLSAVLSADVKGYSRLMGKDEAGTVDRLKEYRSLMTGLIQQYRGRVVDSPGDNILAEFASVVDATECAVNIQEELRKTNSKLPDDRKMKFRIGINLGDVIEDGERIYGDGVNIAARIEGLADAGGICVTSNVYDQVKNKLPFMFEDTGVHPVKNITEPIHVYSLLSANYKAGIEDSSAPDLPDKPSIAVMPFDNMSGDPKQEYFSDGMTEEIITALSKISEMFVIARNSSFIYKGKSVKIQQVGRELGVQYVLEGSVRKAAERVRIT
ncbi:MAG: adenylate/guanylate cyclase domain-containing protein, partial [Desulfobacterales bacterium]